MDINVTLAEAREETQRTLQYRKAEFPRLIQKAHLTNDQANLYYHRMRIIHRILIMITEEEFKFFLALYKEQYQNRSEEE